MHRLAPLAPCPRERSNAGCARHKRAFSAGSTRRAGYGSTLRVWLLRFPKPQSLSIPRLDGLLGFLRVDRHTRDLLVQKISHRECSMGSAVSTSILPISGAAVSFTGVYQRNPRRVSKWVRDLIG